MRLLPLIFSILIAMTAPATATERMDKASRDVLAPHKALYSIEMISRRSSSPVLNIHGQMYFTLTPGCEAWSTDHRFNLYYEYADSPPMQITSDFTTYEPYDGGSFDFNSRRKRDGELYEELRGTASMRPGNRGTVAYATPEGLTFDIPEGGLFPMAHTVTMMKNIREGRKIFNAVVFDGSDEEGPIEINTVVGRAVNVMATLNPGPAIDATLVNSPARKVRMAFFPLASDDPGADYEMDVVLHDNGIISDMNVQYKEFSVSQKLMALEKIAASGCGKSEAREQTPPDKKPEKAAKPKRKLFGIVP